MEFDCYQPYFFEDFDTKEDFYKSTAPSEDIWKKFELLPTPPMSPTRTLGGAAMLVSPGDKLSWLSKFLGQDDEYEGQFIPDTEELFGNLSSIIIQDCMWSSFSARGQLEKVNNDRLSAIQNRGLLPTPHITGRVTKAQCASPDASLATALATDCVDPAAVLTIPTNGFRKPASSGSESRTDSSDDDEEEIDVVTVESKQNRGRVARTQKPETLTVRADPCPARFHLSVHQQQHDYAAPSPDSDAELDDEDDDEEEEEEEDDDDERHGEEEDDEEPQRKRSCMESSSASQAGSSSDTPGSSDNEDVDRRRNHNFLERKRRNDLRSRFMALRDQVPGLVESAKTPKVAILTQATEYLDQLHQREKQQAQEKKRLKGRQQQLLRRLVDLRRT